MCFGFGSFRLFWIQSHTRRSPMFGGLFLFLFFSPWNFVHGFSWSNQVDRWITNGVDCPMAGLVSTTLTWSTSNSRPVWRWRMLWRCQIYSIIVVVVDSVWVGITWIHATQWALAKPPCWFAFWSVASSPNHGSEKIRWKKPMIPIQLERVTKMINHSPTTGEFKQKITVSFNLKPRSKP